MQVDALAQAGEARGERKQAETREVGTFALAGQQRCRHRHVRYAIPAAKPGAGALKFGLPRALVRSTFVHKDVAMVITLQSLGIERLGMEDQLALLDQLWESITSAGGPPLTDAQRLELDRRLADHEANPDDVVSWDEVKRSISERIKQ